MALSNESGDTLVICGNINSITRKFNKQTKIEQVHEYIHQMFGSNVPKSYEIMYYDMTTQSLVNLKDQLRNGLNPFHLNPSIGVERLQDDQIVFNGINNEIHTESNLSENSLLTNDEISQDLSTNHEDRSFMLIPHSIEPRKTPNIRLFFSLDVKPAQRDIYKSDQFGMRDSKPNGRIARVQGIKTEDQKMLQVLPRLRIPRTYVQSNVTLLVAVVAEEIDNGMRIWYKHPDKGFLPEKYDKDTQPINPIIFNINGNTVRDDGDFILNLQMITKWNKSQKEPEEFHRFDDRKTSEIHPAGHDESSPRLFCVLQRHGVIDWDTFCLSDFIRPPKPSKQRSSSLTIGKTNSPNQKRLKVND